MKMACCSWGLLPEVNFMLSESYHSCPGSAILVPHIDIIPRPSPFSFTDSLGVSREMGVADKGIIWGWYSPMPYYALLRTRKLTFQLPTLLRRTLLEFVRSDFRPMGVWSHLQRLRGWLGCRPGAGWLDKFKQQMGYSHYSLNSLKEGYMGII